MIGDVSEIVRVQSSMREETDVVRLPKARADSTRLPRLAVFLALASLTASVFLFVQTADPEMTTPSVSAEVAAVEQVSRTGKPLMARVNWRDRDGSERSGFLDVSRYNSPVAGSRIIIGVSAAGEPVPYPPADFLASRSPALFLLGLAVLWFAVAAATVWRRPRSGPGRR